MHCYASLWVAVCAVLVNAAHVSQEVLSAPASPGVLRRFTHNSGNGGNFRAVLELAESMNLDIWHASPSHLDIYTPSDYVLPSALENLEHHYVPLLQDSATPPVASQHAHVHSWNLSSLSNTSFHAVYHPSEDVGTFTKELLDLYPDNVRLVPIGHSSENREMFALEIFKDPNSLSKKSGFVITGAQHAREWIATSTVMFVAHALLADPSEPYSMASLLNAYVFYIVLVPNPDGYEYTWHTDRFWYKNRQLVGPNEKCTGIDMNRNWGHKWKPHARFPTLAGKKTPPADPCSHWYPGHRPFEAPEVNNIANYITTLPNLRAYIDLRSYGQMISSPFSYSCNKTPKDAEDQLEAALGAARAIKAAHGTSFSTGSLCAMLYKAPGNVVDYMYAKAGIKYAYAVHLRDTGTYGFLLPPEWIRPVGEETTNMIKSIASFIVDKKF